MKTGTHRYKGSYVSYVFIYFFIYFAMAAFSSVLPVYLTNVGKTAAEMSLIVSAAGIFSFAMVPVTGYLCDRTGRPRLISGLLLVALGLLALIFPFCQQVWTLFLLNGLVMSFINSVMPISERLAGACKFRYGTLRVWGTFGYAAGAQAAGVAIQSFPSFVLFVLVLASALLAVLGFAGAENPILPDAGETGTAKERIRLSSFLKNPQFLLFLAIALLFSACSGTNMTYSPMLLSSMGVSTGTVGTVLSVSTLVEIPIILFSNKFMDRFSGKTLLLAAFGIITVQFLFYGFSRSALVVVAAMILLKAIASTLFMMIILKIVRNLVNPELTTTGLSVVNSVNNVGTIILQNVSGTVVDSFDIHILYLGMAVLTALGMALTLFLKVKNSEKVFG